MLPLCAMPVRTGIMLKYSDVLNSGARSPKNYHEQLLQCGGDTPLNVFATINNRWIIDRALDQQGVLEREFLSDSIRTKVGYFRARVLPDQASLIFTRAGALLNLKILLGLSRPAAPFRPTALGACALHANDYVESLNVTSLSSGTLPLIAEFAPVWELMNIREPIQLLRRSFFIYSVLLRQNERMQSLFVEPIDTMEFAGLRFEKYFPLLFGMHTAARSGVLATPFPTSILDGRDVASKAGISEEQFEAFAAAKALTISTARDVFGPLDDPGVFTSHVTRSLWSSDQRTLRNRPLLQLDDGRFLVVDLQFLFESASAGLSWSLAQRLTGKQRDLFFSYWGQLFESYSQRLLGHYYPGEPIERMYGKDGQIDGFLQVGDDVIVFEMKAGFMRETARGSRDPAIIDAALRERFVENEKGERKGVRQLATTVSALLATGVPGVHFSDRVYPVLVGEDPILQTLAVNTYLDDIFRQETTVDGRVAPLTVMLIDELEQILPYVRTGDLLWQELLERRFVSDRVVATSVQSEFFDIALERDFVQRQETFLASHADGLIGLITNAYKDLAPGPE
jgi:hypothetical protein